MAWYKQEEADKKIKKVRKTGMLKHEEEAKELQKPGQEEKTKAILKPVLVKQEKIKVNQKPGLVEQEKKIKAIQIQKPGLVEKEEKTKVVQESEARLLRELKEVRGELTQLLLL